MNKKQEELTELFKSFSEGTQKGLYKIVDRLEQRISKLEKVLESHAKCIGEMREEDIKTWTTKDTSGNETIWVGKR